jgi:hypothetical protein
MYRRPGRRDTNDVSEPTAEQLASLPALTLRGVRRGPAPACTEFQWRAPALTGGMSWWRQAKSPSHGSTKDSLENDSNEFILM